MSFWANGLAEVRSRCLDQHAPRYHPCRHHPPLPTWHSRHRWESKRKRSSEVSENTIYDSMCFASLPVRCMTAYHKWFGWSVSDIKALATAEAQDNNSKGVVFHSQTLGWKMLEAGMWPPAFRVKNVAFGLREKWRPGQSTHLHKSHRFCIPQVKQLSNPCMPCMPCHHVHSKSPAQGRSWSPIKHR